MINLITASLSSKIDVVHMRQLINISVSLFVWVWMCASANSFLLLDGLVMWY